MKWWKLLLLLVAVALLAAACGGRDWDQTIQGKWLIISMDFASADGTTDMTDLNESTNALWSAGLEWYYEFDQGRMINWMAASPLGYTGDKTTETYTLKGDQLTATDGEGKTRLLRLCYEDPILMMEEITDGKVLMTYRLKKIQ